MEGQAKCVRLHMKGEGVSRLRTYAKKSFFGPENLKTFLFLYKSGYYIAIYDCSNLFDIDLWNLTSETSKNENSLEIVSDENLNLNKNLLGGDVGERRGGEGWWWLYRKCVCIKGDRGKGVKPYAYDCVQGERGGSNFGGFCAYVLCAWPPC